MHELYQTIAAGDLKANTNEAFAMAEKGPVIIPGDSAKSRLVQILRRGHTDPRTLPKGSISRATIATRKSMSGSCSGAAGFKRCAA